MSDTNDVMMLGCLFLFEIILGVGVVQWQRFFVCTPSFVAVWSVEGSLKSNPRQALILLDSDNPPALRSCSHSSIVSHPMVGF